MRAAATEFALGASKTIGLKLSSNNLNLKRRWVWSRLKEKKVLPITKFAKKKKKLYLKELTADVTAWRVSCVG
jgi:hypothetical protein